MIDKAEPRPLSGRRQADALRFENMAGENLDDALRECDELMECWEKRFSTKNLALAKRYLVGELEIRFHFQVVEWQVDLTNTRDMGGAGGGLQGPEYLAILKRKMPLLLERDSRFERFSARNGRAHDHVGFYERQPDGDDKCQSAPKIDP